MNFRQSAILFLLPTALIFSGCGGGGLRVGLGAGSNAATLGSPTFPSSGSSISSISSISSLPTSQIPASIPASGSAGGLSAYAYSPSAPISPTPVIPSWCGLSTAPDNYGWATNVGGNNGAANIPCYGMNPISGCPSGFEQLWVGLRPNMGDTTFGNFWTCVPQNGTTVIPSQADAGWCGVAQNNQGTYTSVSLNGATANSMYVSCLGQNPSVSCPAYYTQVTITTTAWNADSVADSFSTCIRQPGNPGVDSNIGGWFGLDGSGGNPASMAFSSEVNFQGVSPASGCTGGAVQFGLGSSSHTPFVQQQAGGTYACIFGTLMSH